MVLCRWEEVSEVGKKTAFTRTCVKKKKKIYISLYFTARVHINKCVQGPMMTFQYSAVTERWDRRRRQLKED
jgi:hypothetical protein